MREFFSSFSFGEDKESIEEQLGAPISEVQQGEKGVVAQYTSQSSLRSDYIHYRDGKAVLFSESWYEEPETFARFQSEFGFPGLVFYTVQPAEEVFQTNSALAVWPDQGIAVYTTSVEQDGQVTRFQRFDKMQGEQYKKDFSYLLTSYREQLPVTQEEIPVSQETMSPRWESSLSISLFGFGVLALGVLIVFWLKKKKKRITPASSALPSEVPTSSYNPSGRDPSAPLEPKLVIPQVPENFPKP